MPSKGTSESHGQGKQPATGRGQDNPYVTSPLNPPQFSVPYPWLSNQGSHAHSIGISPREEPHSDEAIRTLGQQQTRSPESSSSDRRVATSPSPASGIIRGPGSYSPGAAGTAGGRRNAICGESEAIKEYLATHPPSETWGPDDENDSYTIVEKYLSPPTTAGQRTGTAAMQPPPFSVAGQGTTMPSPTSAVSGTVMRRAMQGTTAASVADDKDDETSNIGAVWNDQSARKRGRYG